MADDVLRLALAQLNFKVGDLTGNLEKIREAVATAPECDLVVFPELALTGYPLQDVVDRPDLYTQLESLEPALLELSLQKPFVLGLPVRNAEQSYNAMALYVDGERVTTYLKRNLPNYGVFDEKRNFGAGEKATVVPFKGHNLGLLICEDAWSEEVVKQTAEAGADVLLAINASPFEVGKLNLRKQQVMARCQETQRPFVYVNMVGGQDELVFDGNSMVLNAQGKVCMQLPHCEEAVQVVSIQGRRVLTQEKPTELPELASTYQALVLALHDYVNKNGFPGVLLGLSGGIDSALALAIAVDALGPERVHAVMMPYTYTAQISVEDAKQQATDMGCAFDIVPIESMVNAFMTELTPLFEKTERDTTEENLQARCRGMTLMALSNKSGKLLLTTGNKSELAVGYCTLYGDMCGGFAPIKDVPKTMVYALSRYRNTLGTAIPVRVIERPPSAELAPDQKDEDSLPPYDVLDAIIDGYVEKDMSLAELVAQGYPEESVMQVVRLIELNEYKRQQGAVGPKVTGRNFHKDRRYPITNGYFWNMAKTYAAES
ncbi:NAD+ synthase [Aliidiomarina taiwanensis]|uniref:Glutamine-dependent NAD(+) synthetase n=1 Tax=Aliidiomarina taiwanensis TaxID=946228 RepID=A0A432WZ04_9GAMM|nr:NAD+ synthase [Aliidiomarina taiwanensis]RUO39034.1 NAD+ synthase [Aliidiomarina taiwanensis]